MSEINCNACNELKNTSLNFVQNGITSTECKSLANDTGLNPNLKTKHTDAEDLHDMNDCLVGRMENDLEAYNACDWQDFMERFIPNLYEMIKGIICAIGGIWTNIHSLWDRLIKLEGRVTTLEGRVDDHETRIGNLETDVSGLEKRMTAAEGDITTIKNNYNTLSDAVSQNTSNISTLTNNYNTLSNTVAGHTASINGLTSKYNSLKKLVDEILAAIGGGGETNTVPVIRRYRFTVPANAFGPIWKATASQRYNESTETWDNLSPDGVIEWFSGAGNNEDVGEMWIRIPTTEMEGITGVWTQTWVVPGGNTFDGKGKPYVQTVNIQEWYEEGNYLIVNFDTYIIAPQRTTNADGTLNQNGGPYPVTIDFLVVGTKTIET